MLEASPHSALVHNNLGMALYHREDLPGAIDHFRTAIEFAPEYALASNNLAAALHRTSHTEEALSHYRKALALSPGLMMAGANAGHLLVEIGLGLLPGGRRWLGGRSLGCRSLAVATGTYEREQLEDCGPDLPVDDLTETDVLVKWILQD